MRDYTGAFPDREMFVTWAITTSQDVPIRQVQAFKDPDNPRTPECPELGGKLYDHFESFERAKANHVLRAQQSVDWAMKRLAAAQALQNGGES